jgi:ABC-2 type transport system ATP-binding protein
VALLDGGRLRLSEPTEMLQRRFRRVEVTTVDDRAVQASWLEWKRAGGLTSFVETAYAGDTTESAWRAHFPGATLSAQPMSLREIFLVLARTERARIEKGAAA